MFEAELFDAKCHLPFNNFYTLSCQSETVWTSLIEIVSQKVRTAHPLGCQEGHGADPDTITPDSTMGWGAGWRDRPHTGCPMETTPHAHQQRRLVASEPRPTGSGMALTLLQGCKYFSGRAL